MENVYIIKKDMKHVSDAEVDAFVVPFDKSNFYPSLLMGIDEFDHPEKVYLRGDFETLNLTDYLVTDLNIPFFSRKFIDLLKSLGPFPHRTISCGITDFTIDIEDSYDDFENSVIKPGIEVNDDFEILHLLDVLDILDRSNSDYTAKKRDPNQIIKIRKYAFNKPDGGFPPIFRLKDQEMSLFITESVKNELDAAGIKGIRYEKVPQ